MKEKNNFAMVRCEFVGHENARVHGKFDCDAVQLLVFASEVVKAVAKELSLEPSEIAMLALHVLKLSRQVVDGTENGEES